jgi:hypothetical protein
MRPNAVDADFESAQFFKAERTELNGPPATARNQGPASRSVHIAGTGQGFGDPLRRIAVGRVKTGLGLKPLAGLRTVVSGYYGDFYAH